MKINSLLDILILLSLILITNSLDNHTLSNYKDITITNLTGVIYPDFETKLVNRNITYTFEAKTNGEKIKLDSKYLNIISISEISPEQKNLTFSFGQEDEKLGTPLIIDREFKENETIDINIIFNTTDKGGCAQFLSKEQTIDKDFPYFLLNQK